MAEGFPAHDALFDEAVMNLSEVWRERMISANDFNDLDLVAFKALRHILHQIPVAKQHDIRHIQGALKVQRPLSLMGSNLASVGVLPPTAVKARGSVELGTTFGMIR